MTAAAACADSTPKPSSSTTSNAAVSQGCTADGGSFSEPGARGAEHSDSSCTGTRSATAGPAAMPSTRLRSAHVATAPP